MDKGTLVFIIVLLVVLLILALVFMNSGNTSTGAVTSSPSWQTSGGGCGR